jgi:hypothetical protein
MKKKSIAYHRKKIEKDFKRVKVAPPLDPELTYYKYVKRKRKDDHQ